jgi:Xaa-Pro aminopeptidase
MVRQARGSAAHGTDARTLPSAAGRLSVLFAAALAACAPDSTPPTAEASPEVPRVAIDEYATRRQAMLATLPDGILLLHARATEKSMEQWGFVQDPTFLYFSGLPEAPAAILALDGPAGSAHLFLPPPPASFGMQVEDLTPPTGPETAERYGFDSARSWDDFVPWVEGRLADGVRTLYVDESRNPEPRGVPSPMPPVAGPRTLWQASLEATFPAARIVSAKRAIMEQRSVKSDHEVRILEDNARTTAYALLAVARRLEPGVRQRETESTVVAACLDEGGEGPSFWPWTMSGPNAHVGHLVEAFFRYDQGNRDALPGELVRVDIGCAGGLYGADVGRTLPVSGRFTPGQAEAWDLLVAGYRAGLEAMAHGVPVRDVRAASIEAVRAAEPSLKTDEGRAAAATILGGGESTWHIHGVGIDSGEDLPEVLRSGMVVAYEPGFSIGEDAYYLEDMVLVTEGGHRVLSTGLPYTATEITAVMGGG